MRFEYYSLLFTASSLLLISLTSGGELVPNTTVDKNERIHFMKKLSGAACAYTASWLAHINLFRRTTWYVSFSRNYCTPPTLYTENSFNPIICYSKDYSSVNM